MGCPFCLCNEKGGGTAQAGDFRVSLDPKPWGPRLEIVRRWTDSDGRRRTSTALLPIAYCPMCGERVADGEA